MRVNANTPLFSSHTQTTPPDKTTPSADIVMLDFQSTIDDAVNDPANPIKAFLEKARAVTKSPAKAVVLKLTSMGGSPGYAEELAYAIDGIKKSGKKVVVSVINGACSGGVLVAMPANYIVSNALAQWGSLGTLHRQHVSLMDGIKHLLGIKDINISPSPLKSMGKDCLLDELKAFKRTGIQGPLTKVLQDFTGTLSESFKNLIYTFRQDANTIQSKKFTPEVLDAISDARILTAKQALDLGLIDEIGSTQRAIEKAKELIHNPEATVSEV